MALVTIEAHRINICPSKYVLLIITSSLSGALQVDRDPSTKHLISWNLVLVTLLYYLSRRVPTRIDRVIADVLPSTQHTLCLIRILQNTDSRMATLVQHLGIFKVQLTGLVTLKSFRHSF
jgi:hypothetical protein